MWDLLVEKVPGFQPYRTAFLSEWGDEQSTPEYVCISELVHFTVAALARGENWTVRCVLDVVERWITEGDDEVCELAFVGFIEDLTNGNMHKTTTPDDVVPFLTSRMKQEWDAMIRAWTRRP